VGAAPRGASQDWLVTDRLARTPKTPQISGIFHAGAGFRVNDPISRGCNSCESEPDGSFTAYAITP
jgi:hypothetical protein